MSNDKKKLLLTISMLSMLSTTSFAIDNTVGTGNGIAYGTGSVANNTKDIAIGKSAKVENYVGQNASIAIGNNAHVENMSGGVEASLSFNQTPYSGDDFSSARIPTDVNRAGTGIAIGNNTYARTGSTMVGNHNYIGKIGDVNMNTDTNGTRAQNLNAYSTTIGTNSFSNGALTTNTGTFNIMSSSYTGGRFSTPSQNFGSTITGTLNSIESKTAAGVGNGWFADRSSVGVANTISGVANRTANTNGSLVYGAGNEITNSIVSLGNVAKATTDAAEFAGKLRDIIKTNNGGGATMAIGGGNKADWTLRTSIIGVNNTVIGVNGNEATNNFIAGTNHKLNNVNNGVFIGVADKDNTISDVTNTVSIGTKNIVSGDQTIVMGTEAKATANGAIAIGYRVQAIGRDAIAIGGNQKEPGDYVDVPITAASGRQSIAMGYRAISEGNLSTAIGYGAHTEGATSVAIGTGSATTADDGIAVGNGAMARSAKASAYGTSSRADGENSVAIGYYSDAIAANSVAIGSYTAIDESAENTVVIGGSSRDFFTAKNATALGANTYVYSDGGVAIGSNSRAKEAVSTSSAIINGHTYNFAGGHAASTVSVGVGSGLTDGNANPIEEMKRTITNVAAGRINAESTDAINGSQLHSVIEEIGNVSNTVVNQANHYTDTQVNKGVAKASALAGLKFLDYNPKDKWSFAASVGHYRNANAVAVGAAYQPNENTMIHGGITVDGEIAYNLGVSIKVGGQKYINKYELAEQVKQLQSNNVELREELAELRSMIENKK